MFQTSALCETKNRPRKNDAISQSQQQTGTDCLLWLHKTKTLQKTQVECNRQSLTRTKQFKFFAFCSIRYASLNRELLWMWIVLFWIVTWFCLLSIHAFVCRSRGLLKKNQRTLFRLVSRCHTLITNNSSAYNVLRQRKTLCWKTKASAKTVTPSLTSAKRTGRTDICHAEIKQPIVWCAKWTKDETARDTTVTNE